MISLVETEQNNKTRKEFLEIPCKKYTGVEVGSLIEKFQN
jgi:hypothetical protein